MTNSRISRKNEEQNIVGFQTSNKIVQILLLFILFILATESLIFCNG